VSEDTPQPTPSKLTAKQRVFVDAYLDCLNATEAARRAGYKQPMQQGWRLLRNVEIATIVEAGLAEKAMGRTEVLTRLAEMARSDMREFIAFHAETGETWIDVSPEKPLHLIKEIEITKTTKGGVGEDEVLLDTKIKIKLYDAKSALDTLARHHRIVSGDQPGAVLSITPEQLAQMTDAELEELARKRNLL
jgi:phage terminase small subunit